MLLPCSLTGLKTSRVQENRPARKCLPRGPRRRCAERPRQLSPLALPRTQRLSDWLLGALRGHPGFRDHPELLSSSPCLPGVAPLRTTWPCFPGGTCCCSAPWFAWDTCRYPVVLGEPLFTPPTLQSVLVWTMDSMNSLVGDDLEEGLRPQPLCRSFPGQLRVTSSVNISGRT